MSNDNITIQIGVNARLEGLNRFVAGMRGRFAEISLGFKELQNAGGLLGTALSSALAFSTFGKIRDFTASADELFKATERLESSLKANGRLNAENLSLLKAQRDELGRLTSIPEKTLIATQQQLVAYSLTTDEVKRLTEASVLLQEAGRTNSAETAAGLLGRAYKKGLNNDDIAGIAGLGIQIDRTLPKTEQLKQFFDQISKVGVLPIHADGATKFKNAMDRLGQSIGQFFNTVSKPILSTLADGFLKAAEGVNKFYKENETLIQTELIPFLQNMARLVAENIGKITAFVLALGGLKVAATFISILVSTVLELWAALKFIGLLIAPFFTVAGAITAAVVAVVALGLAMTDLGKKFEISGITIQNWVLIAASHIVELFESLIIRVKYFGKQFSLGMALTWEEFKMAAMLAFIYVVEGYNSTVGALLGQKVDLKSLSAGMAEMLKQKQALRNQKDLGKLELDVELKFNSETYESVRKELSKKTDEDPIKLPVIIGDDGTSVDQNIIKKQEKESEALIAAREELAKKQVELARAANEAETSELEQQYKRRQIGFEEYFAGRRRIQERGFALELSDLQREQKKIQATIAENQNNPIFEETIKQDRVNLEAIETQIAAMRRRQGIKSAELEESRRESELAERNRDLKLESSRLDLSVSQNRQALTRIDSNQYATDSEKRGAQIGLLNNELSLLKSKEEIARRNLELATQNEQENPEAKIEAQRELNTLMGEQADVNDRIQAAQDKTFTGEFKRRLTEVRDLYQDLGMKTADILSNGLRGAIDGVTDSVTALIQGGKSLKESMLDALNAMVMGFIKMIVQAIVATVIITALNAITGGAAGTLIGGFGAARGAAGFAAGGLITDGTTGTADDVPIMASKGEFVINAEATKRNRALIEGINSGLTPRTGGPITSGGGSSLASSEAGGGSDPSVNFHFGVVDSRKQYNEFMKQDGKKFIIDVSRKHAAEMGT